MPQTHTHTPTYIHLTYTPLNPTLTKNKCFSMSRLNAQNLLVLLFFCFWLTTFWFSCGTHIRSNKKQKKNKNNKKNPQKKIQKKISANVKKISTLNDARGTAAPKCLTRTSSVRRLMTRTLLLALASALSLSLPLTS